MSEEHKIETTCVLRDGMYVIRICGVTSGAVVNFGDGDTGNIEFKLDSRRFKPVFK